MTPSSEHRAALAELLDGQTESTHLRYLNAALKSSKKDPAPDPGIAIGLDANVLLNLGKGRSGADVVDYLAQKHIGPIILPSQALIEFWNNQAGGIHALADGLRRQFDDLSDTIEQLDPEYAHFRDGSRQLLGEFQDRYGHVVEDRIATQLTTLLEVLDGQRLGTPAAGRSVPLHRREATEPTHPARISRYGPRRLLHLG